MKDFPSNGIKKADTLLCRLSYLFNHVRMVSFFLTVKNTTNPDSIVTAETAARIIIPNRVFILIAPYSVVKVSADASFPKLSVTDTPLPLDAM